MDADPLRYLEGMEKRLCEHFDGRMHDMEKGLRDHIYELTHGPAEGLCEHFGGRMHDAEKRRCEYIDERWRIAEPRILRAFAACHESTSVVPRVHVLLLDVNLG